MSTSSPTRKEQRDQARAERRRREEQAALDAQRKRRLMMLGGGLLALIVVVGIVIAVASGGSSSSSSSSKGAGGGGSVKAASLVRSEFAGIPQKGNVLGSSGANSTLMVFADMQCPYCRQFDLSAFPQIVKRYVRTGKLKVVFQPISIIGSDSVVGSRGVAAAAQQNKAFDYTSLFYNNQGEENTGYVTSSFLNKLAGGVASLNVAKWKSDLNSAKAQALLGQAQSAAQTAHVSSTPSFFVAKKGQPLAQFQPNSLTDPGAFYGKLDQITR